MKEITDKLIEGYISSNEGDKTFREWIQKNINHEDFPDSLIEYYCDQDSPIEIGKKLLESEFEKSGLIWPSRTGNEIAVLESVFLGKYNDFKISGAELVNKCCNISQRFEGHSENERVWLLLEEALFLIDCEEEVGRVILVGKDVELEIEDFLINSGVIDKKRARNK